MLVDDVLDADFRRALFTRFGEKNDVAIEQHVAALEQQHHHQRCRQIVLVVDGAAPVDVAAIAIGAERRVGPLFGIHVHDIRVSQDEQRTLAPGALESRDDVRTMGLEREDLNGDPFTFENAFHVVGRWFFATRRIGRVHADQRLKVAQCLGLYRGPIDRGG